MAFSQGTDNSQVVEFSRHHGIGLFNVVAVNPNKKELEALGFSPEEEPVYHSVEKDTNTGKEFKRFRAEFFLRLAPNREGIVELDKLFRLSFFVTDQYFQGSTSGKWQIIDEFGRTAWATETEVRERIIPVYSNGPANITSNFRLSFRGEEDLTNFIKVLLGIPSPTEYKNGTFVMKDNTSECLARFEDFKKMLHGDFTELKNIIKMQPNGRVKTVVGIRTTDDGKQYESVYGKVVSPRVADDKLIKSVKDTQANGSLSNVQFYFGGLTEYVETPTQAPMATTSTDPFGGSDDPFAV